MKREIKFRGLNIGNIWHVGHYYVDPVYEEDKVHWQPMILKYDEFGNDDACIVKRDTLGQFTCEIDVCGEEIYEGDILDTPMGNYEVEYSDSCFRLKECGSVLSYVVKRNRCKVIGNIYQNKELLNDE